MKKTSLISGLILVFGLFGRTLQDDTKVTPSTPPANATTSAAAEGAKTEPPSGNQTEGATPAAGSAPAEGGKCKPDEVLTDTGCVLKGVFMNKVMVNSWRDMGFHKVKEFVGVVENTRCRRHEIMTASGCTIRTFGSMRAPVVHSYLHDKNEILHSGSVIHSQDIISSYDDGPELPKKRTHRKLGPPVSGQDRPRKYVFMPGRRPRHGKKCRPNEVRGMKNRCIRKRRHREEHKDIKIPDSPSY